MKKRLVLATVMVLFAATAWAAPPIAMIVYEPTAGDGFAVGSAFEAWVYLDRPPNPAIPGYALPEGATLRFRFPEAFLPQPDRGPRAELLSGGPSGPLGAPFTIYKDPEDARTVILILTAPLPSGSPGNPGLKAIRLSPGSLNPSEPGEYPITIEYSNAGELSGSTQAIARITKKPSADVVARRIRD